VQHFRGRWKPPSIRRGDHGRREGGRRHPSDTIVSNAGGARYWGTSSHHGPYPSTVSKHVKDLQGAYGHSRAISGFWKARLSYCQTKNVPRKYDDQRKGGGTSGEVARRRAGLAPVENRPWSLDPLMRSLVDDACSQRIPCHDSYSGFNTSHDPYDDTNSDLSPVSKF
jgi:hypothetical protein